MRWRAGSSPTPHPCAQPGPDPDRTAQRRRHNSTLMVQRNADRTQTKRAAKPPTEQRNAGRSAQPRRCNATQTGRRRNQERAAVTVNADGTQTESRAQSCILKGLARERWSGPSVVASLSSGVQRRQDADGIESRFHADNPDPDRIENRFHARGAVFQHRISALARESPLQTDAGCPCPTGARCGSCRPRAKCRSHHQRRQDADRIGNRARHPTQTGRR
jgi:hypothetical protein